MLTATELLTDFVDHLAAAIEAVGGSTVAVASGSGVTGESWTASLTLTGAVRGGARLSLDDVGVTQLLRAVLGPEADTSEGAARDLLSELMNQSVGALKIQPSLAGANVALGAVERSTPVADQSTYFSLVCGDLTLQIAASAALEAGEAQVTEAPARPAAEKPASQPAHSGTARALPKNLDVVLDIELPLSVRFGSTLMSIRALSALGPGSIVDMGRTPDDPVEILVCGRPIARAEVVIVGGNYGVRVTDLTSAAERIRAMEGQL